jgi:hypothetical protein
VLLFVAASAWALVGYMQSKFGSHSDLGGNGGRRGVLQASARLRAQRCSMAGRTGVIVPAYGAGLASEAFFMIEYPALSMELQMNRKAFYFWHFSFPRPLAEETA